MFNKKSTRKVALVAITLFVLVSFLIAVVPHVTADPAPAAEPTTEPVVIEPATTEPETETTEPATTQPATVTLSINRNNDNEETTNTVVTPIVSTQTPSEPSEDPTEPTPTEPQPTEPQPTEPSAPTTTEPEATEPEATVHVHEYSAKVVKATCTTNGYTQYVCKCGHAYNGNETAPVAHDYCATVIEPTVDAEGYTLHTCKTCGATKITDRTDPLTQPETSAPDTAPAPEHHHAEIVQGGVTYVFCSDITEAYAEPGYVYLPWSNYPF